MRRGRLGFVLLAPVLDLQASRRVAAMSGFAAVLPKPIRQNALARALARWAAAARPTSIAEVAVAERVPSGLSAPAMALRVLVAEDNLVNQKVIMRMLERLGCQPTVVSNGREALDALDGTSFDAVLMDCQMPTMDGFEATVAIRAREAIAGGHVPIIALTAHAMQSDRERCLGVGMDGYLAKPVQLDEVAEALRAISASAARLHASSPTPRAATG